MRLRMTKNLSWALGFGLLLTSAQADRAADDQLQVIEIASTQGDTLAAEQGYRDLLDTESLSSNARAAAWRGLLKHSSNGAALVDRLESLLAQEDDVVLRRALPALAAIRRGDAQIDGILIKALERQSTEVGVMLVHLLGRRGAVTFFGDLRDRFQNYPQEIQSEILEVWPSSGVKVDYPFLIGLTFNSSKVDESAFRMMTEVDESYIDEGLAFDFAFNTQETPENRALAIELLHARGATQHKVALYRILAKNEPKLRTPLQRCLREWGELNDLRILLRMLPAADEDLSKVLSRLFVSISRERIDDKTAALKLAKAANAKAKGDEKAILAKIVAALE